MSLDLHSFLLLNFLFQMESVFVCSESEKFAHQYGNELVSSNGVYK